MPGKDSDAERDEGSGEKSKAIDEKTMKKLGKLSAKTMKKLAKRRELPRMYEDYISKIAPQPPAKGPTKHSENKGDYLLRDFEENLFDWENNTTKKPAFDAFKNVFDSFDKLRRTFSAKQKEIIDETDFGKNMTVMVALMRQQIEASERAARSQSRRFYISLAIAAVSVIVAVIRIML
ncbi:MAG: hypothetical protein JSV85_00515 [Candidatus Bathyarchaeota archaeon]|nr:MAG: hypothetical protein JSV85_00515 [Candidatus Bathyarchaeota archaeon]